MRAVVAAAATVLVAMALAGCNGSGVAQTGDQQAPEPTTVEEPAEEPAEDPADIPTEGLSNEQVTEIETALIDAEALLASIEAELAQDE